MPWALKRQLFYLLILVIFLGGIGYLLAYPALNRAPSCTDRKQNGTETGIDCGGMCANACTEDVDDVSILWSRSFPVVPGRYNALAYLQNHNRGAVVSKINYRFRFSDKDNVYLGKREGTTFIPPSGNFAIFEGGIDLGSAVPVYTAFEFIDMDKVQWTQVSADKINQLKVLISNIQLQNTDTAPHLSATLKNTSLLTIPEVNVVAILYDAAHNAVNISRTYLDQLAGEESKNVDFTWPQALGDTVVAEELIPMYNIDLVNWK